MERNQFIFKKVTRGKRDLFAVIWNETHHGFVSMIAWARIGF